jgi:hypothetical protein
MSSVPARAPASAAPQRRLICGDVADGADSNLEAFSYNHTWQLRCIAVSDGANWWFPMCSNGQSAAAACVPLTCACYRFGKVASRLTNSMRVRGGGWGGCYRLPNLRAWGQGW